jgi:hypothetical protein
VRKISTGDPSPAASTRSRRPLRRSARPSPRRTCVARDRVPSHARGVPRLLRGEREALSRAPGADGAGRADDSFHALIPSS